MKDFNIKLINWLNDSYDKKGKLPDLLWIIKPTILIRILCRCFIIIIKYIVTLIYNPLKLFKKESYYIHGESVFRLPFVYILLYRKPFELPQRILPTFSLRETFYPSALLSFIEIQKIKLEFTDFSNPTVSIVIPVYNKIEFTINCLLALKKNISNTISYEIIIVNDNSTDAIIGSIKGITYCKNEENLGFLLSSNKGAKIAKGDYICFLNNDTEVQPNWLESLLAIFDNNPDAGIAGSMLIYPDNRLQEAGGIIWNNATGMNYGRLMDYLDPRFNFVRPVDYCSGASILIKKIDFESLGRFDERFIPAYYEDTDLCFAVRNKLNKKVFYQPSSKVIHHEGISSGTSTDSGVKKFQLINEVTFKQKWKSELKVHLFNEADRGAIRHCGKKTILIIDSYVPAFDKESGSQRMLHLITILKQFNYHVIFAPENEIPEEPYTSKLQQLGVEVLYSSADFNKSVLEQIEERLHFIDIAWICRPIIFRTFSPLIKKNLAIKIIYDTIDLHFIRLQREAQLYPERSIEWEAVKALEQKCGKDADVTIAITNVDKDTLNSMGVKNVATIPNIHNFKPTLNTTFEEREGLLFIGGYNHKPNVDAALWLCNEIMPRVWEKDPTIKITLLGSNPPENIVELVGPNIIVPGYIHDVSSYFIKNKLFVAPLTYGAGMKGKIGHSLEYSLPIISTTIGAEGMQLTHDYNCLLANDTASFAEAIIELYFNKEKWELLSSRSLEAILPLGVESVRKDLGLILSRL